MTLCKKKKERRKDRNFILNNRRLREGLIILKSEEFKNYIFCYKLYSSMK